MNTGALIGKITAHNWGVGSMAVLPNGNLASSSTSEIKIWKMNDPSLVRTLTGHEDFINALVVLPMH